MGHQRIGILIEAHGPEEFDRPGEHAVPVDDAEPRRLVAEEDVLGDRQERDQRELLVDDDDSDALAVGDVPELAEPALVVDLALVGAVGIDPAQHLHQRRLPGAVLADQGVDLGGLDRQVDVGERLDAGECLSNPAHFEDGLHATNSGSSFMRSAADAGDAGIGQDRSEPAPGPGRLT